MVTFTDLGSDPTFVELVLLAGDPEGPAPCERDISFEREAPGRELRISRSRGPPPLLLRSLPAGCPPAGRDCS